MKIYKILIHITFFFLTVPTAYSQEATPSANAGSFGKYVDQPVSHFTGTSTVSVPIANLSDGKITSAASLSYHTGGIRVSEIPSAVGLGWTLSAGGTITRTVRGIVDDTNDNGYWFEGANLTESTDHKEEVADGDRDGEPDLFTYAFGGHQGKFFFDKDTTIHMVPKSDLKVVPRFLSNKFSGFIMTDTDGTSYYFGFCYQPWQNITEDNSEEKQRVEGQSTVAISWNLERIESFDKKDSIDFEYIRDYYQYKFLSDCQNYSAKVSGQVYYEGDCIMQEKEVDMWGSLLKKIITPTKEVHFNYTSRVDLEKHTNFSQTPFRLWNVKVIEGAYTHKFNLAQSYFFDNSGSGPEYKRLRLDQVRKVTDGALISNYNAEQPWLFTYNGTFFPKYLSKRLDHWGYYNGATGNDNLDNLVAINSCYDGQCFGSANRSTDETHMMKGALKTVTYPTKGTVTFDYEANTYSKTVNSVQQLLDQTSCDGIGSCCNTVPDSANIMALSQEMIDNGKYDLYLTRYTPSPTNCYGGGFYYSKLEIYDETNGGNLIHTKWYNINTPGPGTTSIPVNLNTISALVADHDYKFKVTSFNCQARVIVTYVQEFENIECGGLRIKKTTINDGISSSNNIIRNFSYDKHSTPGRSSGILSAEPIYAHPAYNTPSITTVAYRSTSIKPLSSLEGYHIGYENVSAEQNGNGQEKFTFLKETTSPIYGFPQPPPVAKLYHGNLKHSETFDDDGNLLGSSSTIRNSSDNYLSAPGVVYRATKIRARTTPGSGWADRYVHKTYANRTSIYRPSKITNVLDGVTNVQDIYYESSAFLGKTKVKSLNSDGKTTEVKTTYTADYDGALKDVLIHYNMIGMPYKTEKYVDGVLVDGKKTIYSNFHTNGVRSNSVAISTYLFPRPYALERYERTWLNGVLQNGSWEVKKNFNRYNANGQLFYSREVGWTHPKYFYYNTDKLLNKTSFGGHRNLYYYYPNTSLLEKKTNVDGTSMSYTYDGLSRLSTATNDCENITKSYLYYNTASLGTTKNYIEVTIDYPSAPNSDVSTIITKTYFDGLGRDIEVVQRNQAPDGVHDMVSAKEYDNQSRVKYVYKAQESPFSNGGYWTPSSSWLKTENHYFDSPLNRMEWTQPPNWHKTEFEYGSNTVANDIRIHGSSSNFYNTNTLFKTITIDPDGKKSVSYKDKMSRLIQSRQSDSNGGNALKIATVYDNKNRATHILPPGVETTSSTFNDLYYKYEYNGEDLMISKKVPGVNTVDFTYNSMDLVNSYRDAHLANNNKWYGYQYDNLGRVRREGFYTSLPTGGVPDESLIETTYGTLTANKNKVTKSKARILGTSNWITEEYNYNICGDLTSSNSNHHLNGSLSSITNAFVYDGADNVTKTISSITAFASTRQIIDRQTYDHSGRDISNFFKVDTGPTVQLSENSFNSEDELEWTKQGFSNGSILQKIDFEYRDHGSLSKINSNTLQGSEQAWNICTDPAMQDPGSNLDDKDLFYLELHYDNAISDVSTPTQKNGNISAIQWQVKGRAQGINSYIYDDYNRLLSSTYSERNDGVIDNSASGRYNSTYTYDDRGNIKTINREGMYDANGCANQGQIDKIFLLYHTNTNTLKNVFDFAPNVSRDEGFQNLNNLDYLHDSNGNLTTHQDKGITISYNHLDLPTSIEFINNSNKVEFLYDANGNMLQRKSITGTSTLETRDYVSGIEYVDGVIESIGHSQGRVFYTNGSNPRYEYNIADHLGNTRLVYSDLDGDGKIGDENEVLWEGHYYPYGMALKGPWIDKPESETNFKYNGIEEISDFGLNLNMAHYRTLDPSIGRWMQVDPKAETLYRMSPYNSMGNNPAMYNDPNGDFIPQLVGGIVGAGLNLVNNWDKILTNPVSAFGYAATGAGAGVVATLPGGLAASRAILAGGNAVTDIASGNLPKFDSFTDVAVYAGGTVMDAFSTTGSAKAFGKIAQQSLKKAAIKAGKEIAEETAFSLVSDADLAEMTLKWYGEEVGTGISVEITGKTINWGSKAAGNLALGISIDPKDQIDRDLLNEPTNPGNAPTFKSDGTSVEIHHVGPEGPYEELHRHDHRGKGNYNKKHPPGKHQALTKSQRNKFNSQRRSYWRKIYKALK